MSATVIASPDVKRSLWGMGLVILVLHAVGWGVFAFLVQPHDYRTGDGSAVFGTGLAVTAYLLGARHAFDADHIAAIDNTSRRLAGAGARPVSTGFWFALGHSTIVLGSVALLAGGLHALAGALADDGSVLKAAAGIWGPAVSGTFLLLIGAINLVALTGIYRAFRSSRASRGTDEDLERALNQRGLISRILAPVANRVDKPWKMYPLGFLFGLGLDTATTIGLFVVAGGAVVLMPWYAVMVLPILFTAGMVLCDTLDGLLMSRVYRSALNRPERTIFYNLVITGASVVVAFLVGTAVLAGLFTEVWSVDSGPVAWLGAMDLQYFGFAVVGIFVLAWAATGLYGKAADMGRTS